jgi:hypothetical protein
MDKRRWIKNYVMILLIMGSDLRGVEKETRREIHSFCSSARKNATRVSSHIPT